MGHNAGTLGAGLVVGLAVGLGAGFLLFGAGGDAGLGGPDGGLSGPDGLATAVDHAPDPLNPSAAPPAPAPLPAPPGGFDSFRDAVDAASKEARRSGKVRVERGDGAVTGRVMTDDGTPLAGVLIRGVRYRQQQSHPEWRPGDAAPRFDDLDRRVRERVEQREQRLADTVETTTDNKGAYRLAGLVEEKWYRVSAYFEGYEIRPVGNNQRWGATHGNRGHNVRAGGTLDLLAMPITVVRVTLSLPDGSTPERATLQVTGTHSSSQPWVPRDPTLRLAPGSYKITATVPPDPERAHELTRGTFESEPVELEVTAGTPDARLALGLTMQPGLAGKVSGFGGDQNHYIRVYLLRLDPGVKADKATLAASNQSAWARGNNPIYRFADLAPGRYLVGAGHANAEIEVMQEVEVGEGITVADLALQEPDAGEALTVLVTGPNGRPVGNCNFWLTRRGQNHNVSPGRRTRTETGGHRLHFAAGTLTPTDPDAKSHDGKPFGPWMLWASSPLYGQTSVQLGKDQREASLQFQAPAQLICTIPGYAESELKNYVTIEVTKPEEADETNARVSTSSWISSSSSRWGRQQRGAAPDAKGVYTQGPLEPGPRVIKVYVASSQDTWGSRPSLPAYTLTVTLVAGDNRVALRLPVTHELNVQMEKPEGDRRPSVQIQPAPEGEAGNDVSWWGQGTQANEQGVVLFKRLPPGRYRLFRHHNGVQQMMHVVVPAQQRVRFAPEAFNAMQVWISDDGGLLGGAGLHAGDLIVEVDGTPFADTAAFVAALRGAGETVSLGYRRGGETGAVKMDRETLVAGMMSGQGLGGGLTPAVSGR